MGALYHEYSDALDPPSDWEAWMALQYIEIPEQHLDLGCFFTPEWRAMLEETLEGGLQAVVGGLSLPVLLDHGPFVEVRKRLDDQAQALRKKLDDLQKDLNDRCGEVADAQVQLVQRFQVDGVGGQWGTPSRSSNPGTQQMRLESTELRRPEPYIHVRQDIFPSDSSTAPRLTSGICQFSIDGDYMASGGSDGFLYIWSPNLTQPVGVDCGSEVLSFAWKEAHSTERLLLYGLGDGQIRLFDVHHNRSLQDMTCDAKYPHVGCLAFRPSTPTFVAAGYAAANENGVLLSYDLRTGQEEMMFELMPEPKKVTSISFNQNGRLMVSGSFDGSIRVFDMSSCQPIMNWHAHDGEVSSVFFSSDETAIISAGVDGRILQWSLHHLSRTIWGTSMPGHDGISSIKLCPNGDGDHFLASSQAHKQAYLYYTDTTHHQIVQEMFNHTTPILDIDWHPVLNVVASLAEDGTFCATKLVPRDDQRT